MKTAGHRPLLHKPVIVAQEDARKAGGGMENTVQYFIYKIDK
jgi:hypothetical protein